LVGKDSPFYVPPVLDVLGRAVCRFSQSWLWLGKLESLALGPQIADREIKQPIYVCGLARSGSTLLHEVLAAHPQVATHRIKDYPFVSTPYWWRRATAATRPSAARERPHRDKMMITSDSPDALEEMLWMAHFPHCHDPHHDNRLGAHDRNPPFDRYYRNHLRKLMLAESKVRYAAKANYHLGRLEYLLRLFPDARFVIPVRDPESHIASLMRQHQWFAAGHRESPPSLTVMQTSGHFEFGLDRRPTNLGNHERVQQIEDAWSRGHEVRGWAVYWDMVYNYLADLLDCNAAIRKASVVVSFDDLCVNPANELHRVLDHCALPDPRPIIEKFAPGIRTPDYYSSGLTTAESAMIRSETAATVRRFEMLLQ
jgi:hypothetical protein